MTFGRMTLLSVQLSSYRIVLLRHSYKCQFVNAILLSVIPLNVFLLNVISLSFILLNVNLLNVILLIVILLNVILLIVILLNVILLRVIWLNVLSYSSESHSTEWHTCRDTMQSAIQHYHITECHSAECYSVERQSAVLFC